MNTAMTNSGDTVILETPRLFLRQMTPGDFPLLCRTLQDSRVMYAWEHAFSDREVHDWIERNIARYQRDSYGYWLAFTRDGGEHVGQIGLLREEFFDAEHIGVGWILCRDAWGKGFAAEGGAGCMDYAFRRLGASRVVADIRPENTASLQVAARLGMRSCGSWDKIVGGKVMLHTLFYKRSPMVRVSPYDPQWAADFNRLRDYLAPVMRKFSCRLEHAGSTSVPGLAAKPVIDADLLLKSPDDFAAVCAELRGLGLEHVGGSVIPGREMFSETLHLPFALNFYVCPAECVALRNHLCLRNYLRANPAEAARYGKLKQDLAQRFPEDVDAYCEGKTSLIVEFLTKAGFAAEVTEDIRRVNTLLPDRKA